MSQHHVTPIRVYLNTLLALICLTVLTVVIAPEVTGVHPGFINAVLGIGIATLKATLVCAFFMGLKYDNKLHLVILLSAVFFLLLLLGISSLDIYTRVLQVNPITG